MIHELKTWPIYFRSVKLGEKTFEIRRRDRDFSVGDTLLLHEYDPGRQEYTGDSVERTVTYICIDPAYCLPGFCVMGIKP